MVNNFSKGVGGVVRVLGDLRVIRDLGVLGALRAFRALGDLRDLGASHPFLKTYSHTQILSK